MTNERRGGQRPAPRPSGAPPSPRDLAGRRDPARAVRPVDWTATGAVRPAAPEQAPAPAGRRARTVPLPRPEAPPPADALHTAGLGGSVPALHVPEEGVLGVGAQGASHEQIVLTVADPQEAWTSDGGVSDHYLRAQLVVQVRRADTTVIGVFSRAYALSVRPADGGSAIDLEDGAGRSARRGRGTRHPTSRRELLSRLREAGFVVSSGATHGRITHPQYPGLFVPMASTPSDVRFTRHAVAQVRRVFGIDLRR